MSALADTDWDRLFHTGKLGARVEARPAMELDRLIARYQAPYPDDQRRCWIQRRLQAWAGRQR